MIRIRRSMINKIRTTFLMEATFVALLVLFASCTSGTTLKPKAEDYQSPMTDRAARVSSSGITLVAEGSEWFGREDVKREVTPLKVEIQNNSDMPVRIRYRNIHLSKAGNNKRYAALPLFEIDGTIREPTAFSYTQLPYRSRFYYDSFYVSPFYRDVYPVLSPRPYPYGYRYDMDYYDTHITYWNDINLPTRNMREAALPEGVIEPGGSIRGHIFFEKVPARLDQIRLHMDAINEETGQQIETLVVPLKVTG